MKYIGILLELLQQTKYKNKSESIQTALGKYHLPETFGGAIRKILKQWR
jgi:hypothetical protein